MIRAVPPVQHASDTMLQAIRGKAGSWIVKILFVFLILSFAIWGIGDIFRSRGPEQRVATVGEIEITAGALEQALRREVERFRQIFGPDFDTQTAVQMGLPEQALQGLVAEALYDQTAADLGISLPDAVIAERIRSIPAFRNPVTQQFDRQQFLSVLAANGLTEPGFVAQLRRDLARDMLASAVAVGAAVPAVLADELYRYRRETRTAETVTLRNDAIQDVPAPTEEQLAAYHAEHSRQFTTPEYRVLTVLGLTADDLAAGITIAEDRLRAEYESRQDTFRQPERRGFDQVLVADREQAAAIAAAARQGAGLRQAAAAVDPPAEVITLDPATREEMLPALASAGFALPEGGVSDPVQSPFGWHVLQLASLQPDRVRPFEEVRAELETQLKHDAAVNQMVAMANQLDDTLAGGATLEEAAQQLGLRLVKTPPVARDGTTDAGTPLSGLPVANRDKVLEVAFGLEDGQESRLEDTGDGYFVARVDAVVEPVVRPLEAVRDQVAAGWTAERKAEAARALAERAAERMAAGETAAAVAAALGPAATAGETPALLRDGSNRSAVPAELVTALFTKAIGEAATAPADGGQVAARLTAITPAEPGDSADAAVLDRIRQETRQSIATDLLTELAAAMRARHPVEINHQAVSRLYPTS